MVETPFMFWIWFNAAVLMLLVIDLLILDRRPHPPTLPESILTTLVWVTLALGFGSWLTWEEGWSKGSEFFAGYVIEYSLSVDNLFLFVLIFASFQVGPQQQRRLLFWGVIGALIMRGIMIGAGAALLDRFAWIIYLFGAYILYAGVNMLRHKAEEQIDVEQHWVMRFSRRFLPMSKTNDGMSFVVRENGRPKFTMLFIVLLMVELTDLVFALDSIPAIFGVTTDPFIVYTSNVCAILGLRSLYFVLAGAVKNLVYLHVGLAFVLIFIGLKMVGESFYHVPTVASLVVVATIIGISIVASLIKTRKRS